MHDVLGEAIQAYHQGNITHKLWINNRYGRKEEMPIAVYFRNESDMPELEKRALQCCKGRVLDIGAGAGSHSLLLQQMGMDVTALDVSAKALSVAKQRGVQKTIEGDIFTFTSPLFDTLLLLMNGIGLAGTIDGLTRLLHYAKTLINKNGQVLFDSSDVAYLFKKTAKPTGHYYGEIEYQYQYKKSMTPWFKWLYVDVQTLYKIADTAGWKTELLMQDGYDQYLARLTLKGK